jgi:predicted DNA-binding protein
VTEQQEEQIQTALRLPKSVMKRLDKLAELMSDPGMPVKRTEVLRRSVFMGLERLEAEQKKR